MAVPDFLRVARGNRGDEIRIDDASFHEVDRPRPELIEQPVAVHELPGVESHFPQQVLAPDPLVAYVVQRETHPRMMHPQLLIHLVEQHRHQGRLPVVAMNNIRMFVALEQELHRRPAEKSEAFSVIRVAVKDAPVEEIALRVGLDKEALQVIDHPEIDITMDRLVVIGYPQIPVAFGQAPDAIVAHAVVLGQDDFHRVAANGQFLGQSLNDIRQPADFGGRRAFWRDHDNKHTNR